ncbi:hypothetical protein HELRODRAFT_114397 [Helobdella robusta]|uniref:Insulin-induced gene 1 protein n=1 Tax=Helobdella robusta TaxID=6412 RepID=T1EG13_HELRO|nr:hypothetical protein HELRODRAFT_114397 [Helobdella robusta]ESN97090.1 hypothetical protein HELRODRAFT_114397 [Helobdella robusta]
MSFPTFVTRAVYLFSAGIIFSLVLNLLQLQRQANFFPAFFRDRDVQSSWWLPVLCGVTAAVVGLLYPYLDEQLGERRAEKQEWSSVMRCVAIFVGINHASAKIDFSSNLQLTLTLTALSVGLWWLFDGSRGGLMLGIIMAAIASVVCHLLIYHGIYRYTSPDFTYLQSWLPCIFFSGGVTIGNIGRQLAQCEQKDEDYLSGCQKFHLTKEHRD